MTLCVYVLLEIDARLHAPVSTDEGSAATHDLMPHTSSLRLNMQWLEQHPAAVVAVAAAAAPSLPQLYPPSKPQMQLPHLVGLLPDGSKIETGPDN